MLLDNLFQWKQIHKGQGKYFGMLVFLNLNIAPGLDREAEQISVV